MNPASVTQQFSRPYSVTRTFSPRQFPSNQGGESRSELQVPRYEQAMPTYQYTQPVMLISPFATNTNAIYALPATFSPVPSYQMPNVLMPAPYGFASIPQSSRSPYASMLQRNPSVPRRGSLVDNQLFSTIKNFGYCTGPKNRKGPKEQSPISDEGQHESTEKYFSMQMTFEELYLHLMSHLNHYPSFRISWLNRLFSKVGTKLELERALEVFNRVHQRMIATTPETGTLLIKAACRVANPDRALELLKHEDIRLFPTLGGIHFLMINYSLARNTKSVLETFEIAKKRDIQPSIRTYHILIRECVDNGLIQEAMRFAHECTSNNIPLNRVTYNILMNGCRKANKPGEILHLRSQMDTAKIEINDTTVKFTSLAHMMLDNTPQAVQEFLSYSELDKKGEEFCQKFFEVTSDEQEHKKHVLNLFSALKEKGQTFPTSVEEQLGSLQASLN